MILLSNTDENTAAAAFGDRICSLPDRSGSGSGSRGATNHVRTPGAAGGRDAAPAMLWVSAPRGVHTGFPPSHKKCIIQASRVTSQRLAGASISRSNYGLIKEQRRQLRGG